MALSLMGSFAMDAYLPAFSTIAQHFDASQPAMQTTLTLYLAGYGVMSLLHGPLSDSFGRRTVLLWGTAAFSIASIGCAVSGNVGQLCLFRALQGMSAGAGTVVARTVLRDRFSEAQARKAMAAMIMFFAAGPAVAPIIGATTEQAWGWRGVFWLLAGVGLALLLLASVRLEESLPVQQRRKFRLRPLMSAYRTFLSSPRFILLATAAAATYNALFLYILASPTFLGRFLSLKPDEYFWLFVVSVAGVSLGARYSAHLATRLEPRAQLARGFAIMIATVSANTTASVCLRPDIYWTLPLLGLLGFGWALLMPVISMQLLDLMPQARGMASSMQLFMLSTANILVSAVVVPLAIRSLTAMAVASLILVLAGTAAWKIAVELVTAAM